MVISEATATRSLVDFLNHGILPFAGRREESAQILRFWQGTFDAQSLRALLVVGEAGIGKSRILEEVLAEIAATGGAVAHAKLYPGAATAIAPLIARAIRGSQTARQITPDTFDEKLPDVIAALQRMARLRPTLLVVEDIHLLTGETLGDFATLLHALSDEALSVLCIARAVDLLPRGILERYMIGEIRIDGLMESDLRDLWHLLFGGDPAPGVIEALLGATNGNPLAVCSALRSALGAGEIERKEKSGGWHITIPAETFARLLHTGVHLLAEGMAAHLSLEERAAAEQLASLGEIFSRESAAAILEDAGTLLDLLMSRGILTIAGASPTPIAGIEERYPSSNYPPIAFAHSLVHRYCMQEATIDRPRIAAMLAGDHPLYSILPFQLLGEWKEEERIDPDIAERCITRGINVAHDLDQSPDWELALPVLESTARLADHLIGKLHEDEERTSLRERIISCRLSLLRRSQHTEEYSWLVWELVALTADPVTAAQARRRMIALVHLHRLYARFDRNRLPEIWKEIDSLLLRFSDMATSKAYISLLRDAALDARREGDAARSRMVEERIDALMASGDQSEELRHYVQRTIAPSFLVMFESERELEERLKLFAELDAVADETGSLYLSRMQFLASIGRMEEVLEMGEIALPQLRERGLTRTCYHVRLLQIYAEGALGLDLPDMMERTTRLCAEAPEPMLRRLQESAGFLLSDIALQRGEIARACDAVEVFPASLSRLSRELLVIFALDSGDADELPNLAAEERGGSLPFKAFLSLAARETAAPEALCEAAIASLRQPILRLLDLQALHATIALLIWLDQTARHAGIIDALRGEIGDALSRTVLWLSERKLPRLIEPIVARYGNFLPDHDPNEWSQQSEESSVAPDLTTEANADRLAISMLGVVAITTPGGEQIKPRGPRLRTLLGLMVADRILERPLEHREFCRLASDNQEDPEHARKVVNVSVFRLRELLGQEAILTDSETPRLNLDIVEVDLLEADRLLKDVEESIGKGSLMRAFASLGRALDITAGEVPFPSLYDRFFEAVREDFEGRMRGALLDVAHGLLYEGDAASAGKILRRARASRLDDEEIAELLKVVSSQ